MPFSLLLLSLWPLAAAPAPDPGGFGAAREGFLAARREALQDQGAVADSLVRLLRCPRCGAEEAVPEFTARETLFPSFADFLKHLREELPRGEGGGSCAACGGAVRREAAAFLFARRHADPPADLIVEGIREGEGRFGLKLLRLRPAGAPEPLTAPASEADYRKAFGGLFSARDAWAELLGRPASEGLLLRKIEEGHFILRWPVSRDGAVEARRQQEFLNLLKKWEGGRPPDRIYFLRELFDRHPPFATESFDRWLPAQALQGLRDGAADGLVLLDTAIVRRRIKGWIFPPAAFPGVKVFERAPGPVLLSCPVAGPEAPGPAVTVEVPLDPILEEAAFTGRTLSQVLAAEIPRRAEEVKAAAAIVALLRRAIPKAGTNVEMDIEPSPGHVLRITAPSGARRVNLLAVARKAGPGDPARLRAAVLEMIGYDVATSSFRTDEAGPDRCFCGRPARAGAILRRREDLRREFGDQAPKVAARDLPEGFVQVYTHECAAGHLTHAVFSDDAEKARFALRFEAEGAVASERPELFSARREGDLLLVTGYEAASILLRPASLRRFLRGHRFPDGVTVHAFAPFTDAVAFAPRPIAADEIGFLTRLAREEIARAAYLRELRLDRREEIAQEETPQ